MTLIPLPKPDVKFPVIWLISGFLILLVCITGCTQIPGQTDDEASARINNLTWYLVTFHESGTAEPVINGTTLTAFLGENGLISGSAGCNGYSAAYSGGPDSLTVGSPISTEMYCESPQGIMTQETRYLSVIPSSASYTVQENSLELADANGTTILTYTAIPPELMTTWRIITFGTAEGQTWTPGTLTTITLRFNPDGTISGNAGCNDYTGKFQINGADSLVMGTTGMTKMFCGIGGVMELEEAYVKMLQQMKHFSISDNKLLLSDSTGTMRMMFERKAT
jgi:heat shock protein HslJ